MSNFIKAVLPENVWWDRAIHMLHQRCGVYQLVGYYFKWFTLHQLPSIWVFCQIQYRLTKSQLWPHLRNVCNFLESRELFVLSCNACFMDFKPHYISQLCVPIPCSWQDCLLWEVVLNATTFGGLGSLISMFLGGGWHGELLRNG